MSLPNTRSHPVLTLQDSAGRQIDALAHELYRLTEEEIAIVKGLDHE